MHQSKAVSYKRKESHRDKSDYIEPHTPMQTISKHTNSKHSSKLGKMHKRIQKKANQTFLTDQS